MTENAAVIAPTAAATETAQVILRIVREVLGRPGLGLDDDLFDHGATSLSFVRVLATIRQQLHAQVHAADLDGIVTAANLAFHAEKSRGF